MAATSALATSCAHCGQPAPAACDLSFCCDGCKTVYDVLSAASLLDYYGVRAQSSVTAQSAPGATGVYHELDHPAFAAAHVRELDDGAATCELYLENVHCAACVWLVEKLPRLQPGVVAARLSLGSGVVEVTYEPKRVRLSAVARTLATLGYAPHPYTDAGRRDAHTKAERRMLLRLAITGAVFGNVMLLGLALYSGVLNGMASEHVRFFRWASLVLVLPSMVIAARTFFAGALGALRTGAPHMDLPISLALVLGFAWGTYNTITGQGEVYFDTLAALVFLLLVSRWLQLRHGRSAGDAAAIMHAVAPSSARLSKDGEITQVPCEALVTGDVVEVRAGDRVPVDGIVVEGTSHTDVAFLSGESTPRLARVGSAVHAGAICLDGRLLVRTEKSGRNTRLGELVCTMERVQRERAPIVRLADRIAGIFTVTVLALAALTFVVWALRGAPWEVALDHTVAMLIVTCPCALGMATPLAMSLALTQAARAGLFIKNGETLERVAAVRRIVFDKTGTLTWGRPRLHVVEGDETVLPQVRALEAQVSHPLAHAFLEALPAEHHRVHGVRQVGGSGIEGYVNDELLHVGSLTFARSRAGVLPTWIRDAAARLTEQALTPVVVVKSGVACAIAGVGDAMREDARAALEQLRSRGLTVEIASGDDTRVALRVGAALGFAPGQVRGGMSPQDKLAWVGDADESRPTMMIGDGVNDAVALGAASVGVAVHGGAEASLAAADVYVAKPGVLPIVQLVEGAERTLWVVKRNIALSLLYNMVAVLLAFFGLLSPWIAALLMPLSSLSVVTSSLTTRTFRARR